MNHQTPSPAEIRQTFDYDSATGLLTWKVSRGRVSKGSEAGTLGQHGYVTLQVNGKRLRAHRAIWAHVYGVWPSLEIDHKDGNRANNRIENLREATSAENKQNLRGARSHSATGLLGVFKFRDGGKFMAQIVKNGKGKHIGVFDSKEEAHAAYLEVKRQLHPMCTI
jgi:hypothetical protein